MANPFSSFKFPSLLPPMTTPVSQAARRVRDALYAPPRTFIDSINDESWPNPLQPVIPMAPPGAGALSWPLQWGQNINYTPRADAEYSADTLRGLARYIVSTICIENNKDILTRMPWRIQLRPLAGETAKDRAKRSKGDAVLSKLTRFFERPNWEQSWPEFLSPIIDDLLVIDAPSVFIGREKKTAKVAELRWVDGSSIVRLVDEHGWTPRPPNPAYQQLWEGYPRTDYTADQLVYKPRRIAPRAGSPSSFIYGYCYDSKTEILTKGKGWILFKDLELSDQIATRNIDTKKFEWQVPSHITNQEYTGEMYHCYSNSVDLVVTPQHRMLVSRPRKDNVRHEIIQLMDALATSKERGRAHNSEVQIPMTSVWEGSPISTKIFTASPIKPYIKRSYVKQSGMKVSSCMVASHVDILSKPVVMSGDEYCAFMGAYLSEGWYDKHCVYISQNKESKGFEPYRDLLKGILGRSPYHNPNREFVISRHAILEHVKQCYLPIDEYYSKGKRPVKAHLKFIPEEIMNSSKEQIRIFWDYYMLGDGSKEYYNTRTQRGSGSVPEDKNGRYSQSITTISKRMADQLVELAQKLGWSASFRIVSASKNEESLYKEKPDVPHTCHDSYEVNVRYSQSMSFHINKENYSGTIHCATVPNGVLYVRRNGKPAWSGNSATEQVAKEIEVGIARLRFVYDFYTEGNIPGIIHFAPVGTSPDKIKEAQGFIDSELAGNLAKKRRLQIFQGFQEEGKPEQTLIPKEPILADVFDEFHIRKICFAFGTSPQRLMRSMNRASATAVQESAEEEGTLPWLSWLKGLMDYIIQELMGFREYEFAFDPFVELDKLKQSMADSEDIKIGLYTRNEKRQERGDDPVDSPEADELMVMTSQGLVPLDFVPDKPTGAAQGSRTPKGASQPKTTRTVDATANLKAEKPNGHSRWAQCSLHKDSYPRINCHDCVRAELDYQQKIHKNYFGELLPR